MVVKKVVFKIVCLICVFLTNISCDEKLKKVVEYYPNGNAHREYFVDENGLMQGKGIIYNKEGVIESFVFFKDNKPIDSIINYSNNKISSIIIFKDSANLVKNFNNGSLVSEGHMFGGKKIGYWNYYKNNKKYKVIQFINLCGEQYSNQGWVFNDKDNLVSKGSNFFRIIDKKDRYKKDEEFVFYVKYQSLWGDESMSNYAMSTKITNDFCNIRQVKLDSFTTQKHLLKFYYKFSEKGKKNIRGYIREYGFIEEVKNDFVFKERKVYFDIPVAIE